MKKCSKCGKENIDEAIFCADCGTRLDSSSSNLKKCPNCGEDNPINAIYCEHCTAKLDNSSPSNSNSNEDSSNSSSNDSKTEEGPDKLKICCCYVTCDSSYFSDNIGHIYECLSGKFLNFLSW